MSPQKISWYKKATCYYIITAIVLLLLGSGSAVHTAVLKKNKITSVKSAVQSLNQDVMQHLAPKKANINSLEEDLGKVKNHSIYFAFVVNNDGIIAATSDNLLINRPAQRLDKIVPGISQQLQNFLASDKLSHVVLTHDPKTDFFISFSFLRAKKGDDTFLIIRQHASQTYFNYLQKIQHSLSYTMLFVGLGLFFVLLSFDKIRNIKSFKSYFILVALLSGIFLLLIVTIISWRTPYPLNKDATVLYRQSQINHLVEKSAENLKVTPKQLFQVPFGVYITNLSFDNANSVNLSLWLWRKLPKENENIKILLPQKIKGTAEVTEKGKDSVFWRYNTLQLQQQYAQMRYPFDDRYVNLQFWHTDVFNPKVIMYPDIASYDIADRDNIVTPQLDPSLKVKHWDILDSFYVSNKFQVGARMGKPTKVISSLPEQITLLVLLRRDFTAPFMKYYLPLIIILMMYFIGLLTSEKADDEGGVFKLLTYNASLLFVVTVAANAARDQITTNKISFIEVSYIIVYVVIVLFSILQYSKVKLIENYPKLAQKLHDVLQIVYWPLILGAFLLTTIHYFW